MRETGYYVQIIRAFRGRDGITNIYNYKGDTRSTGPIGPLQKTVIDESTVRWTDKKILKKKKK